MCSMMTVAMPYNSSGVSKGGLRKFAAFAIMCVVSCWKEIGADGRGSKQFAGINHCLMENMNETKDRDQEGFI